MFKILEDCLTSKEIEDIKDNVRLLMKERYGDAIERSEIAIGNFYNGVALIYIGYSQKHVADIYGLESHAVAQLAINPAGEFIKFKIEKGQEYFGYETYNSESDSSLVRFDLRRAKEVIGDDVITTENFSSWAYSKDTYKLSDDLFCYCLVEKGAASPNVEPIQEYIANENDEDNEYDLYEDFYEGDSVDIDDEEKKIILDNTFYIRCWGASRAVINPIKLDTNLNTLYVIRNRYILLCDNMCNYMPDDYIEYDDPDKYCRSYYNLFARYHISSTDILEDRYGVFDLFVKKTIIHVGEMRYCQAMISGFTRLDFLNNDKILTFDYFDIKAGKGIPYNSKLTYDGVHNLVSSCIDGREFNKAANIITYYWNDEKTRTGKNAGEWYIIREGKNAGRTLCWLLSNDRIKDIVKMIVTSYLYIDDFQKYTYPSSYDTKKRNKIWLALDTQKIFEEIKSPEDYLELEHPFSQYSMTKHQSLVIDSWGDNEPNFEELVEEDTDYLVGLINNHCLLVDGSVFDELEESYKGNDSYLNKLFKVKAANNRYKEDIEDYEKRCEDEIHSRWEEEEQRYWENEGYRSAFEDDPGAEWNID